jgi:hypothetical protein
MKMYLSFILSVFIGELHTLNPCIFLHISPPHFKSIESYQLAH